MCTAAAIMMSLSMATAQSVPSTPDKTEPTSETQSPIQTDQQAANSVKLSELFADRLRKLSPHDPEAYVLLGEEVAEAASTSEDRRLSIELFVLGFECARAKAGQATVAASACYALAELVTSPRDRRYLEALAQVSDPANAKPLWLRPGEPTLPTEVPYQLAETLGLLRSGEGYLAKQRLARPEVKQAFESMDRQLRRGGWRGGASGLYREADNWPCRGCQNKRVVRQLNTNPPQVQPCPICLGKPGPELTLSEFTAQIRLESFLLQGKQRSWAAQLGADGGAPLIETDPSTLSKRFSVDPAAKYWIGSGWHQSPTGVTPTLSPIAPPAVPTGFSDSADTDPEPIIQPPTLAPSDPAPYTPANPK